MAKAKPKKAEPSSRFETQKRITELSIILGRSELAKRMGVTPDTISRWATGKTKPKNTAKVNRIYAQKKPKTDESRQALQKEVIKRQVRRTREAVTKSGIRRMSVAERFEELQEDSVITNAEQYIESLTDMDLEWQFHKDDPDSGRFGYLGEDINQGGKNLVVLGLTAYQSPKRKMYVTDIMMDESEKGLTRIIEWKPTSAHLGIMKLNQKGMTHAKRQPIIWKNFMKLKRKDGIPSRMIGYYFETPEV